MTPLIISEIEQWLQHGRVQRIYRLDRPDIRSAAEASDWLWTYQPPIWQATGNVQRRHTGRYLLFLRFVFRREFIERGGVLQ